MNDAGAIPPVGSDVPSPDRGAVRVPRLRAHKKLIVCLGIGAGTALTIAVAATVAPYVAPTKAATVDTNAATDTDAPLTQNTATDSLASTMRDLKTQMAAAKAAQAEQAKAQPSPPPSLPVPNIQQGGFFGGNAPDKGKPLTPVQRKESGDVTIKIAGADRIHTEDHENNAINDELKGGFYADGNASVRSDLDFLLIHGTTLPCVLKTKVVTDYHGLVICQLSKDVYSADGKILLLDAGSSVFGEQKVAMTQGKSRVFINWSEIETPNGVRVRIDSLGTDAQGAAGVDAWVDNHFMQRFGGAIMLSFLDDLFQAGANAASKNSISFNTTSNTATDMASKALDNSINIAPTAYVNPGTVLSILMARDVDMRSVYRRVKAQTSTDGF